MTRRTRQVNATVVDVIRLDHLLVILQLLPIEERPSRIMLGLLLSSGRRTASICIGLLATVRLRRLLASSSFIADGTKEEHAHDLP